MAAERNSENTVLTAAQAAMGPRLAGRHVDTLAAPCPRCQAAGHTTYGGDTPRLCVLPDAQRLSDEPDLPFCHVHGYIVEDAPRTLA